MARPFRYSGRHGIGRDVDEELAFHLAMRERRLIESGLDPDAARREALRQFGDITTVRASCVTYDRERDRAMRRTYLLDTLRQDVAYGLRTLTRNAGFAAGVVLTLALGLGGTTAIFTLIHALLLQQLPVADPHRLVAVGDPALVQSFSTGGARSDLLSYPLYRDVRDGTRTLSGVLASGRGDRVSVRVDSGGAVETPSSRYVSDNYFTVLGVPAAAGRVLDGTEEEARAPVVVISHRWWTRRFGQDRSAVGRTIGVNGVAMTIVGVTPPSFLGEVVGSATDLWIPLGLQPLVAPYAPRLEQRDVNWIVLLGRLAPGATLEQARAELAPLIRRAITDRQGLTGAAADSQGRRLPVFIESGATGLSRVRGIYTTPLVTLLVGVGVLLLVICANVANLLLARGVARAREMTVRLAIGAGRARLVRQLLTESMVLAALGCAAGALVAYWGSHLLLALAAEGSALALNVGLDLPVLGFLAGVSLLATVLFGLVPALRASRVDLAGALKAHARSVGSLGGRGHGVPLGRLLIAGQIALSLVLVLSAALLVRNLRALQAADPGLARDRLLIVDVSAARAGYRDERMVTLATQVGERLARLPGALAVSWSENGIFSGTESANTVMVPGFVARDERDSVAFYDVVGPDYVAAIGGRVLRGRDFAEEDDARGAAVVLINGTMARFYFGDTDPIDRTIRFDDSTEARVVGVVADVKDHSLTDQPVRRFYVSFAQAPLGYAAQLRFIVRAENPARLTNLVRREIESVDGTLTLSAQPLSVLMYQSIRERRLVARLATGFGALALLLAAVGLHGVMTYAMSRRTGEIGLRVALGAQRADVVRMVLAEALAVVGAGVVVGAPLAFGAARLLGAQIEGVGAADPVALAVALGVLALNAFVAAVVPAVRAARVAPLTALRQE